MNDVCVKRALLLLLFLYCGSCTDTPNPQTKVENPTITAEARSKILAIKDDHLAATIGIGVIDNGKLASTVYLGEQAPGIPASSLTMFNTASVNKAVTTETFLRLAEKGLLALDEPVAPYYVHPDLVGDPLYDRLTPRIILTHKTGFLNWPHDYEDGKLAFRHEPGDVYGYSGAGFMILANYIQNKIGKPFPDIVKETVFSPVGMTGASITQESWMETRIARPLHADGSFDLEFELNYGYWNSADDLYVTVEDYAKFLVSVMNGDGVGTELATERYRVQADLTDDAIWGCDNGAVVPCPAPYGHGLGWFLFGYGKNLNIQHGGNDVSEAAIAYFNTETHDGLIVFVNAPAPQGVLLWPKIVDILDENAQFTAVFHHIIAKYLADGSSE